MEKVLLPCRVTDAELTVLASEMAELLAAIDAKEDQGAKERAAIKAELAELQEKLSTTARQVRTRTVEREVTVEEQPDYSRNKVCRIRLDTGEVISEREMQPSERQLALVPPARKVVNFAQPDAAAGDPMPGPPPSPKHWSDTERGEDGLTDEEIERAEQEIAALQAPVDPVEPQPDDPAPGGDGPTIF